MSWHEPDPGGYGGVYMTRVLARALLSVRRWFSPAPPERGFPLPVGWSLGGGRMLRTLLVARTWLVAYGFVREAAISTVAHAVR